MHTAIHVKAHCVNQKNVELQQKGTVEIAKYYEPLLSSTLYQNKAGFK